MSKRETRRVRMMLMAATAALAILPASAWAQQAPQRATVNIAAQDLGTALTALARLWNREIFFPADLTRGKRGPRLSGRMTFEHALDRLLAGSGLGYRVNAIGSIVIERAPQPGNDAAAAADEGEGQGQAEILVVGGRSQNVDIRRTEDDTQPYVVFTGDEIERSGAASVNEYLFTRLPQNQQSAQSNATIPGLSGINLRGLGLDETLILIDGRRAPTFSQGSGGGFQQPRIDGIPPSMIERIEILPATAGGIYGGNATGGVVNIILKHDYSGLSASAAYGNTFDFAQEIQDYSLGGGLNFNKGRTRLSFSAAYRNEDALDIADRSKIYRAGRELFIANDPNAVVVPLPFGYTPNICATATTASVTCAPTNLVLDNGVALGSNRTFVPLGYSGPFGTGANDGGAALAANAGQYNTDVATGATIINAMKRYSGSLGVQQELSNTIRAFADFSYGHVDYRTSFPTTLNVNIPATSPFNPFQQNIVVGYQGALRPYRLMTENWGGRSGLIVNLPGRWNGSVEYGYAESLYKEDSVSTATPGPAELDYLRSVILRDPNQAPFDLSLANFNRQLARYDQTTVTQNAAIRAGGPLVRLPAGPVTLNSSAQWERIGTLDSLSTTTSIPGATSYALLPGSSRVELAAYSELRVPLFSERNAVPLLRSLELTGAVRVSSYSYRTSGALSTSAGSPTGPFPALPLVERTMRSADFTFTGQYSPVAGILFRASYGTGFLPPNLAQLVGRTSTIAPVGNLLDPARNNQPITYSYTRVTAGNPSILPERSRSFSAGVVLQPQFIKGLRVSLDYVELEKDDELFAPGDFDVITNPALYPNRVTREPLTPADAALGYSGGRILAVDTTFTNLSSSRLRAFDFQIDYRFDTRGVGNWRVYGIGTYQPTLAARVLPTSPEVNSAGYSTGPLRWRANFGVDWKLDALSAGWNAQFYDRYRVCTPTLSSAICTGTLELRQGARSYPRQIYHDVNIAYRFGPADRPTAELSLIVQNLFDKAPPPAASLAYAIASYGDPRMRRFLLSIRKQM